MSPSLGLSHRLIIDHVYRDDSLSIMSQWSDIRDYQLMRYGYRRDMGIVRTWIARIEGVLSRGHGLETHAIY